VNSNNC